MAEVQRTQVNDFQLEARVSVRDGSRSSATSIFWSHRPTADEIDFLAPTGQVMGRLESSAAGAVLQLPGGERRSAPTLDALASELFGIEVPVSRLSRWVQAAPGTAARRLRSDQTGRPALISEGGWVVEYVSYADESAQAPVRRLEARWGEVQIQMIVDDWSAR
ncbi:MAG: outer membrane lipoprotein LolB [Rhodocyclaceae bacterium]|nr:outer membrane lipoprotein LolB [Rhodocyclaceae bacterium]